MAFSLSRYESTIGSIGFARHATSPHYFHFAAFEGSFRFRAMIFIRGPRHIFQLGPGTPRRRLRVLDDITLVACLFFQCLFRDETLPLCAYLMPALVTNALMTLARYAVSFTLNSHRTIAMQPADDDDIEARQLLPMRLLERYFVISGQAFHSPSAFTPQGHDIIKFLMPHVFHFLPVPQLSFDAFAFRFLLHHSRGNFELSIFRGAFSVEFLTILPPGNYGRG